MEFNCIYKIQYGKCMNKFAFEVVQCLKNVESCSLHDVAIDIMITYFKS